MQVTKEERKVIRERARQELARRNFKNYLEYVHEGRYTRTKHTDLIADALQPIADGEQRFLIVELPPRHSKSMTITETFPSYFLGKNPYKSVITTGYSETLAKEFGRLNRMKINQFGNDLFGVNISRTSGNVSDWKLDNEIGGMLSTGIGGSITGKGADCFPAGTMIDTSIGKIDIKDLHEMKNPPLVLSYNHERDKLEYKKIQVTRRKKSNEFTKISTVSGNEIISTKEHRYYDIERGYREAYLFRPNDKLAIQTIKKEQTLYSMQKREEWQRYILSRLLPISEKENRDFRVQFMSEKIREVTLRIQESVKKKSNRFLLLERMFERTPFVQKFKGLPLLWRKEKESQQILQSGMYDTRQTTAQKEKTMSDMSKELYSKISKNGLLFEKMCQLFTLKKNGGNEQQPIQKQYKSCKGVFRNKTDYIKTRQLQMSDVQTRGKTKRKHKRSNDNEFGRSSYQRGYNRQYGRKFNNVMHDLSHETPQIKDDTVRSVENYEKLNTIVYDLQVEDNHNFFANNLLVHNCMIIDDPIKNRAEAESETYRNKIWAEWESTLSTRLQNGASVIVVQTRWHEDDFTGRLLEKSPRDWIRIRLPAIAEDENDLLGRKIGEALAPDLGYDEEWAEVQKKEVGTKAWLSLYQQRPSASEGNMFKREWWQWYNVLPSRIERYVISWDLTFKGGDDSDYVVGQLWGKRGSDYYLIDQVRGQMDFPETLKAIENFSAKYPRVREILIEDKANGSAVISTLKSKIGGIIPIKPQGSKEARAMSITPLVEAGNVYLPKGKSFINDFMEEVSNFPYAKNDKQFVV